VTKRICLDCGTDITDLHGNAKRCTECRVKLAPPSPRKCSNGCDAPVAGRGLCARCRIADVRLHGPAERLTPEDRFWDKVNKDGPVHPTLGPCWLWGGTIKKGYPLFFVDGQWVRAFRYAYELLNEAIPEGLRVRRQCDVEACVNPAHVEIMVSVKDQAAMRREIIAPPAPPGSEPDLAYWGALLDGEGHLGIRMNGDRPYRPTGASRYIARLSLGMTDERLVREFAVRFGIKTVQVVVAARHPERSAKLDSYRATTDGAGAARILSEVMPFLRLKRRQAELMIQLEQEKCQPGLRTRYTGTFPYRRGGQTVYRKKYATGQEHLDRWHGYFGEVKRLNHGGRSAA
jgi:hypothetical protein